MEEKKTFLGNNTIWYAFYIKFVTFNDFEKVHVFFEKKRIHFFKKTQILYVLRSLAISVAFYGKYFNVGICAVRTIGK